MDKTVHDYLKAKALEERGYSRDYAQALIETQEREDRRGFWLFLGFMVLCVWLWA